MYSVCKELEAVLAEEKAVPQTNERCCRVRESEAVPEARDKESEAAVQRASARVQTDDLLIPVAAGTLRRRARLSRLEQPDLSARTLVRRKPEHIRRHHDEQRQRLAEDGNVCEVQPVHGPHAQVLCVPKRRESGHEVAGVPPGRRAPSRQLAAAHRVPARGCAVRWPADGRHRLDRDARPTVSSRPILLRVQQGAIGVPAPPPAGEVLPPDDGHADKPCATRAHTTHAIRLVRALRPPPVSAATTRGTEAYQVHQPEPIDAGLAGHGPGQPAVPATPRAGHVHGDVQQRDPVQPLPPQSGDARSVSLAGLLLEAHLVAPTQNRLREP